MVELSDLAELYDTVAAAGGRAWLAGGWAVDALAGEQTRAHDDVDIAVPLEDVDVIRRALESTGFEVVLDELPGRLVLLDRRDRRIDLHVVRFYAGGRAVQRMPSGESFRYPPDGFGGSGTLNGKDFSCLSARLLMEFHAGYEPQAKDRHNVALLNERVGAPLLPPYRRPAAVVTGASRRRGIAAAVARSLARAGWDIFTTSWRPYDASMPWGSDAGEAQALVDELRRFGATAELREDDLADPGAPARIFDAAGRALGRVDALVNAHAYSTRGGVLSTTADDFDRHVGINARGTLGMTAEFARRFDGGFGMGRVVNVTSDALLDEISYTASKGAVERITLSAALELAPRGITVNALNPGPTDTGWMSETVYEQILARSPLGRVGAPGDAARLITWLCSYEGRWVTGQILYSNGGFPAGP